jgi:hypothetical protein
LHYFLNGTHHKVRALFVVVALHGYFEIKVFVSHDILFYSLNGEFGCYSFKGNQLQCLVSSRPVASQILMILTESTSFTLLLPMLGACFAAMTVPALLGNAPITDSLRERTLRR